MVSESKLISFLLNDLSDGGVERVTLNLAEGLLEKGYEIHFICFQKKGDFLSQVPEEIQIIDLKVNRAFKSIPALSKYIKKYKPDVLFSAKHYINVMALITKSLSFTKTKIVVAGHGMFFPEQQSKLLTRFMQFLYPKADKIIAVSQGVAENIAASAKIDQNLIEVIYNPVITEQLKEKVNEEIPFPKEANTKYILSVGRLSKEKDFATLINAFEKVHDVICSKLIIIGEGPEREKLENLISKKNLENSISLSGFSANPYATLKHGDLFVLSSLTEGLPTVIIEALYCGVPVISTDCPSGPREILENGKFGKLVSVGDESELASEILRTLDESVDKEKLKARSLRFSSENAVINYTNLIEELTR